MPPHDRSLDLAVVDALARLQLVVRRAGLVLRVHSADERLRELVQLAGLAAVVCCEDSLVVEAVREPEAPE